MAKIPLTRTFVFLTNRFDAFNFSKEFESLMVTSFSSKDISLPLSDTIPFSPLIILLPLIDILSTSGSIRASNSLLSQKLSCCDISGCDLSPLPMMQVASSLPKQIK